MQCSTTAAANRTQRHPATDRQTPSQRRWRTDVSTAPPSAPRDGRRNLFGLNIVGLGCLFVWIAGVAALSPPCHGGTFLGLDSAICERTSGGFDDVQASEPPPEGRMKEWLSNIGLTFVTFLVVIADGVIAMIGIAAMSYGELR
jgi:hypothetical protein